MALVPAGEGFSADQKFSIDQAIRSAETVCRYEFSVFVGAADSDSRSFARQLHGALVAPERSVLIFVDPAARALEIVTGSVVRRDLDDSAVKLAAVAMQSAFTEGDLVGGIKRGVSMLADQARSPETLHS